MVESKLVELVVAGSNPVGHPSLRSPLLSEPWLGKPANGAANSPPLSERCKIFLRGGGNQFGNIVRIDIHIRKQPCGKVAF